MENLSFSIIGILISTLILYIIGLIKVVKSKNKYKYSPLWILIASIFFFSPVYIFLLYPYFEKKSISNNSVENKKSKGKIKEGWLFFISYMLYFVLLNIFFKYELDTDWFKEISIVCVNTAAILYQLSTFFIVAKAKK